MMPVHNIWKTLRVDKTTVFQYEYLKRSFRWAASFRAGIIIICNGKILLVRERPSTISAGFYGFPKGSGAPPDNTVIDTAIRECYEEVGLMIDKGQILYPAIVYPRQNVSNGELIFYFIVKYTKVPDIKINTDELTDYIWLSLDDICIHERIKQSMMSIPTRRTIQHLARFTNL